MPLEIERKFLVCGNFKTESFRHEKIVQGYLSSVPQRTVRVRIKGDKAYLTIKGISDDSGISRYEWEKEIAVDEAQELMTLCEPGVIDKIRYYVKRGKYIFEVDEFKGHNDGLIVAEIELTNENDVFDKPDWLGEEVTGNTLYYNASLANMPYSKWDKQ